MKIFTLACLALVMPACSGEVDVPADDVAVVDAGTAAPTAEPEPVAAVAAQGTALALDGLGLTVTAPDGATVTDMLGSKMVMADDLGFTVGRVGGMDPASAEAVKEEAVDMYSAEAIAEETLDDGWAVTYTNTGSMGTNYWVHVHRDIGGTAYKCTTSANSAEAQASVLAACKTLAAAE